MKKILATAILIISVCACYQYAFVDYVLYDTKRIKVHSGMTGYGIAYQYIGKQEKYNDVREFWYYITQDSGIDTTRPLGVGDVLVINLYKKRSRLWLTK